MVFVLMLFGCIQNPQINNKINNEIKYEVDDLGGINMSEVVETGDSIKVDYVGKFPDTGEVFDKSEGRGPLSFTAGAGQMIKGFDSAVIGMKLNEEKTIILAPEDAYGVSGSHPLAGKTLEFWIKIVEINKN